MMHLPDYQIAVSLKRFKNILNTAQASANDVAVMFLDLDRFKKLTIDSVMASETCY